jgi:hypothetical protein
MNDLVTLVWPGPGSGFRMRIGKAEIDMVHPTVRGPFKRAEDAATAVARFRTGLG